MRKLLLAGGVAAVILSGCGSGKPPAYDSLQQILARANPESTTNVSRETPYSTVDFYRISVDGVEFNLWHTYGDSQFIRHSYDPSEKCELHYNGLSYLDRECDGDVDFATIIANDNNFHYIDNIRGREHDAVSQRYQEGLRA